MGHRALVAYRRSDDTFRLHYAHWGRDLAAHVSTAAPLGGPVDRPDGDRLGDLLAGEEFGGYDGRFDTRVDPRPLARDVPPASVGTALDPSFESLVVVSPAYDAATFLVCSPDPSGDAGNLVLARPDDRPESLREWFVDEKSRLSAAVERGTLTRRAARDRLRRGLDARAETHSPDDASFLREP